MKLLNCFFRLFFYIYAGCKVLRVLCRETLYKAKRYFLKNKTGNHRQLLEELKSNEEYLQILKTYIATNRMISRLTLRDKINIELKRMSWPRAAITEDIKNMTPEEVVAELEK